MKEALAYFNKLPALLERYRYPLLILLAGLALLLIPGGRGGESSPETSPPAAEPAQEDWGRAYCAAMEKELEAALSQMEGAGQVRVLLSLKTGPAARYQTDVNRSSSTEEGRSSESLEEKTVMLERGGAYNEPAVVSTAYPVFQGALILAQGAGDPELRLRISAAAAALLGLGADQITVVKMK